MTPEKNPANKSRNKTVAALIAGALVALVLVGANPLRQSGKVAKMAVEKVADEAGPTQSFQLVQPAHAGGYWTRNCGPATCTEDTICKNSYYCTGLVIKCTKEEGKSTGRCTHQVED